jgi:cell division protein FtsW (lipid II flippase)
VKPILSKLLGSKKNQSENWFFIIACLIPVVYAIILTMAPAIRQHTGLEAFQYRHWIGVMVWLLCFILLHRLSSNNIPQRDPILIPIITALSGIGLLTIWRLYPDFGMRQTIWLALGSLVLGIGTLFPAHLDYLRRYKYILLFLGLTLTILTIIWGYNPNGTGPTLWLNIFGVNIQPSEPLKLLLITFLAGYFSDKLTAVDKKIIGIFPTLILTGVALLLLIFQRDLGTASIFLLIYLALLFTIQGNKVLLWVAPALVFLAGGIGYLFIDIIQVRIDAWLSPFVDPTGTSYQIIQSIIGIAEGGLLGTGPGLGSPGLIPVSLSDFIFPAIAEELGLLGAGFIILLLILLIYRGTKIALATQNSFHRYLALGLSFYFGIQSILIIGGNIGLLPLTGVTLPFVSYGGSSLIISFTAILMLLSISAQERSPMQVKNPPRFAIVSVIMIALLILEVITTSLISFWFKPRLVARADNPRPFIDDLFVERGDILDRNNQIIVTNSGEIGRYQRTSQHIPLYPIIGYSSAIYGQTGIEASMLSTLRGYQGYSENVQFWRETLYNQPPEGLDVRLTIDLDLQRIIDERLGNYVGSVLVMNAESGEILAAASHPYFDATNLETQWEDLILDEDGPLLNRSMQSLYPPGASLLPILGTAQISLLEIADDPTSILSENGLNFNCALPINEEVTWNQLFTNGCLTVQNDLASITGQADVMALYEDFGLLSEPQLRLLVANAVSSDDEISEETFFLGQAPFQLTPLQMGLAASAITNQGILPSPRIVSAYKNPGGEWITLPKLSTNQEILSSGFADRVLSLIKIPEAPVWQITSIAMTEEEERIAWFIAGTTSEWQGQPTVLVVLLEDELAVRVHQIGIDLIEQFIISGGTSP